MKKYFTVVLGALLLIMAACNGGFDPVKYNDTLVEYFQKADSVAWVAYDLQSNMDIEYGDIPQKLDEMAGDVENLKNELQTKLKKNEGDPGLYDAVVNFMDEVKNVLTGDMKEMYKYEDAYVNATTEDSTIFDKFNDKVDEVNEKLSSLEMKVNDVQLDYAEKFNLRLE